ncbi:MAG: ABC transporter substrate-binding protein [Blautia sp.]|nr:ABC transporter substrate-binding protein [Blautia sp.]
MKKTAALLLTGLGLALAFGSLTSASAKEMTIGSGQSCSTLDVVNAYDGWYAVRYGFGQTLTKMNDDLTISGWLVEDNWTVSEDNKDWTFTVKDGVTFSNGNVCDGNAVKASLENVFENGTRGPEYFTMDSVEADGQNVTIHLTDPVAILPNMLADPLFTIVDTSVDMSDAVDKGQVGTGPFVVESFDQVSKAVTVVKNENYWAGDVKMDRITFLYTENQSQLTWGLEDGSYDAVYNLSMTDVGRFEEMDGFTVQKSASGRTAHGFMNQNGQLKDPALRQAIMEVIDKQSICDFQLNGQYVAGKTLITSAADYGYDELTDPFSYDPQKAAETLDEAGYVDVDGDGYREDPEGNPIDLNFVYYTGRPEQEIMVQATQLLCADVGIKITPVLNDTQTVIDRLAVGDYDMLCMSINVLNCADPENHMNTYFKTGGSYASYGWSNPDFDGLMDTIHVTTDPAERVKLIKEAEQILLDEAVCIYFCYPIMNFSMHDGVSGIYSTPADYYWVSEETDIAE